MCVPAGWSIFRCASLGGSWLAGLVFRLTERVRARYRAFEMQKPSQPESERPSVLGAGVEEAEAPATEELAVVTEAAPVPAAAAVDAAEVTRQAGRGGLAVAVAKAYFILQGLVQQIALQRVLGLDGYGGWSSVNSLASATYNPVIAMSIQGVSRAVSSANPAEQRATLRRVFTFHAVFALLLAGAMYLLAPWIMRAWGAPHLTRAFLILCPLFVIYGLYAPLIGALNGQRLFTYQAGFDILAATIRTAGLALGAWWFVRRGLGVEGAAGAVVLGMAALLLVAFAVVGVGRSGSSQVVLTDYLGFVFPVMIGQTLLNLLLQADFWLLRLFASQAAVAQGYTAVAADPLVGAYRATQVFSFLPYQLLISVNFVLFPMLATAVRDQDDAAIARYVSTGIRIAVVVAGLMASVTSGLASALLTAVFGREAAALGARSLELLALGFGAFAIFGVFTAVLNSLRKQFESMAVTGFAALVVAALCYTRVRGEAFGDTLLLRTATATSVGLVLATFGAAWLVKRAAGSVVAPITVLRVVGACAATVLFGRMLNPHGLVRTIGCSAMLALFYIGILVLTKELSGSDLQLVRTVIARRAKRK